MSDTISDKSVNKKRGRPRRDDSVSGNVLKKIASLTDAKIKNERVLRSSTVALKQHTMGPPITPTQNRFTALSADANATLDSTKNVPATPNIHTKRQYIPPIVIEGSNYNTINNLLTTNNIIDFKIKLISLGVKLTLINLESYNKVKSLLQTNKIEHFSLDFSFSSRNLNPIKVILTGLPEVKSDDLKAELIKNKIDPDSMKEVITSIKI